MKFYEVLAARYSSRAYKQQSVPAEIAERILAAGCAAPIGMRAYETIHLTLIQDEKTLAKLRQVCQSPDGRDLSYGAPALILVSTKANDDGSLSTIGMANASCMVENMLLASSAEGLGSCYIYGIPTVLREQPALCRELQIPEGFLPTASLVLGYAEGDVPPAKELKVHLNCTRL